MTPLYINIAESSKNEPYYVMVQAIERFYPADYDPKRTILVIRGANLETSLPIDEILRRITG